MSGRRTDTADRIADMLADGLTIAQIAERLGTKPANVNGVFQRIRKALRVQAV